MLLITILIYNTAAIVRITILHCFSFSVTRMAISSKYNRYIIIILLLSQLYAHNVPQQEAVVGKKIIQCEAAGKPMGYCANIHGLVMVYLRKQCGVKRFQISVVRQLQGISTRLFVKILYTCSYFNNGQPFKMLLVNSS